jgi:hypothetical protein
MKRWIKPWPRRLRKRSKDLAPHKGAFSFIIALTPEKSGTLLLYPLRLPMEDTMINLAQRLANQETDADRIEFIRGAANLNAKSADKKIVFGAITGLLLAKVLKKNG